MTRLTQKNRISEINNKILLMADLVEKQILKSMSNLKRHDPNFVEEIIKDDDKVDELQQMIEEECIIFIATEQPLAKDLRNVFIATKISTDLERMADHAVDICKAAKKINFGSSTFPEESKALWDMEEKVRKMINMAVNAYVNRNIDEAYEICKMDDTVDELYRRIFGGMMKIIKDEEVKSDAVAQLLFIAKYLERIGDRVTNICEGIIFAKNGTYVDLNE